MNKLEIINEAMTEMGLNYEFMEWSKEPIYPYFVGEYQETEPTTEDGLQESTVILSGFTRGTWLDLETAKATIENYFNKISGKIVTDNKGNAVAIFYANSTPVQTGDAELKRIDIYLTVKEWKVN